MDGCLGQAGLDATRFDLASNRGDEGDDGGGRSGGPMRRRCPVMPGDDGGSRVSWTRPGDV